MVSNACIFPYGYGIIENDNIWPMPSSMEGATWTLAGFRFHGKTHKFWTVMEALSEVK